MASDTSAAPPPAQNGHDAYAALRSRNFRLFFAGGVLSASGGMMLNVAVGWEIYARTHSPLALGYVGLVQIVPVLLLSLPAGHLADHFDRRKIVMAVQCLRALAALGLAWLSLTQGPLEGIYLCLFVCGVSRAFQGPARSALLPQVVTPDIFGNAVAWGTSGLQLAWVAGPAFAGWAIARDQDPVCVYLFDAGAALVCAAMIGAIRGRQTPRAKEPLTLNHLAAGGRFVWNTKVVLAAMLLDLFAVLLGGATALMPIYADEILCVGPQGLGWLRAAPAVGALLMALWLAHHPPLRRAGLTLLWGVAGFGLATIIFGLSTSLWLSLAMLALCGACDNISMVVRQTLIQLRTPDEMRGRVAAVNSVFVNSSNELGELESGLAAHFFGPMLAVVCGGLGTLAVVAIIATRWPELRRLGLIHESPEKPPVEQSQRAENPVV